MDFEKGLLHIMENYLGEKNSEFKQNELAGFLRNEIIEIILKEVPRLKKEYYVFKGSPGAGNWAEVPWISIFNKNITSTAQKGIYIVFLFSSDMKKVYLSLNQGYTFYKENGLIDRIEELSDSIRNFVASKYNRKDLIKEISLRSDGDLGKGYEKANIISKIYTLEELRNGDLNIKKDIEYFLEIYDYIYNLLPKGDINIFYKDLLKKVEKNNKKNKDKKNEDIQGTVNDEIGQIEMIDHIYNYIKAKGFIFAKEDISNLYLSMKTKPFVLLAGISGTGKSKMIQLFAEAIGIKRSNGRYNLISVKPDWNDGTELFGYIDINGDYIPGILTKIVYDANQEENLNKPYIVCLDEMNLARVEYYLSDYLSIIETRERVEEEIKTCNIFSVNFSNEENKYSEIYFSDNIYIVGTVNMDDTTFSFSKKVLDRANTIEFSNVDLSYLKFDENEVMEKTLNNIQFKTSYLNIKETILDDNEYVERINNYIIPINSILEKYNMHFAYRIRDEIIFYMLENSKYKLLTEEKAFDYQVLQKILPRINGSGREIKLVLIDLYNFLNSENQIIDSIGYLDRIIPANSQYTKSTKKIKEMLRSYENGYVSFW